MQNSKCKMQNDNNEFQVKRYKSPKLEVIEIDVDDIIATSPGTETDIMDETDGSWEIGLGL